MIKKMKNKKRIIIALGVLMLPSLVLISCNKEEPSEEPVTEIAETSTEEVSEESTEETTEEVNEAYEVWNFTEYDGSEELKFGNSHKLRNVQYYDGKTWIVNKKGWNTLSDGFLGEGTEIRQTGDEDYDKDLENSICEFYLYDGMVWTGGGIFHINQLDFDGPIEITEDQLIDSYYEDGKIITYKIEHMKSFNDCKRDVMEFEDPSNEVVNQYIRKYDAYTGEKLEEYVFPEGIEIFSYGIHYICNDYVMFLGKMCDEQGNWSWDYYIFYYDDNKLEKRDDSYWKDSGKYWTEYFGGNVYDMVDGNFVEAYEQGEKVERILIKDFEQKCNEIWDMENNLLLYEDYDGNLLLYDIVNKEERKISDPPELKRSDDYFFTDAWLSEGHVIVAKYIYTEDEDRSEVYEYDLDDNETFVTDMYGTHSDIDPNGNDPGDAIIPEN